MTASSRPSGAALAFAWAGAAAFAASLLFFLYSYFVRYGATTSSNGGAAAAIGVDVLLFSAFALHHSVLAREPVKVRVRTIAPPWLERSFYTWTASLLFLIVCAWWRPVPGEPVYALSGPAAAAGYLVQLAGIVLTARGSGRLDVLDLAGVRPVLLAASGGPPPAGGLETRGLYGFVRHPIYFAWILVVFGAPVMTPTRLVFAAVSTAYVLLAVPFEERALLRTFGDDYRAYQARVRWRVVPGLY